MPKPNQNQYLVSFSTGAFGNQRDIDRFLNNPELDMFLHLEFFSKEDISYIINQLGMHLTKHLAELDEEDIKNELPNLNPECKEHLLDITTWAKANKDMIYDFHENPKVHEWFSKIDKHKNTQ